MKATKYILALALLAWPATAAASDIGQAREVSVPAAQRVHLVATEKVQTWVSPRTFSSRQGYTYLLVDLYRKGQWLRTAWHECVAFGYGPGFAFRVSTCGDPTPVRLRYRSFEGRVPFTLVFKGGRD
jgi:hypothetical protein